MQNGKFRCFLALLFILTLAIVTQPALAANGIGLFLNASTSTNKTSQVRITNLTATADTITATAYSETGAQLGTAGASLGAIAAQQTLTFSSAQLESAIGFLPSAGTAKYAVYFTLGLSDFQLINYTRDGATGALTLAQSLTSDRSTNAAGPSVSRSAWFVSASTSTNKTNVLRLLNTSAQSGTLTASLYSESGTLTGSGNTILGTIAAHQMLSYTSAELETALGFVPPSPTAKYRVVFSANVPSLELINFTKDIASGNLALVQAQLDDRPGSAATSATRNALLVFPSTSTERNTVLRIVNPNPASAAVTAVAYNEAGTVVGSGALGTVAAQQILALTSAQIEAALGYAPISVNAKYRLVISADAASFEVINNIKVPSTGNLYLAQAQTDNQAASTAATATRHAFIVYPSGSTLSTTQLHLINPTAHSAALTATAYDDNGTLVASGVALGTLAGNQTLTFTSAQLESLLGYTPPTTSSKWRIAISAGLGSFELINYAKDVVSGVLVLAQAQTGEILAAPAGVTVSNVNASTVGSHSFSSSAKLGVAWTAPAGYAVDHYLVTAADAGSTTPLSVSVAASATGTTLTGLKSGTSYSVTVSACKDSACSQAGVATAVSRSTSEEYWQLQGSGATVAGLTKIVSDGNARISATRFGPDAGGTTASRIQLYYGPINTGGTTQRLVTAVTGEDTSAATSGSYLSFTSMASTTGLVSPPTGSVNPLISVVATGQGVPLSAAMGGKVRLFFEAQGTDGKTRIMYLDSQDGYVGRDFNSGSATTCSIDADYLSGGCVPTVAIGVEGDSVNPTSKILNARQFKLGYPTLNDWRWDGAVGSFMVFTSGPLSGCTTAIRTHSYAVWDGSKWNVQYHANGCPKAFDHIQAGFPFHVGGVRYKMYYGDTSDTTGKVSSSNLPFLGPKKLIYADGANSGSAANVDYEDWESLGTARNVNFLWPSGELFNAAAEGYIDDFHFMSPTGSLDLQVMYMAITDGVVTPIAAAAVLLNP